MNESRDRGFLTPLFGPLQGVRVLCTGMIISAPYAAQIMAELGAEMIWIERPGLGDMGFRFGPQVGGKGLRPTFAQIGRNRLSVELDLNFAKNPEAREVFLDLAKQCDIWINGLEIFDLNGTTDEMVLEANPALVIVHISGYGRAKFGGLEAYHNRRAMTDYVAQAASGYASLQGFAGEDSPVVKGYPADYGASLWAAVGALSAYINAQHTGKGEVIDVSLTETQLTTLGNIVPDYLNGGVLPAKTGMVSPVLIGFGFYKCKDGRLVSIGIGGPLPYNEMLQIIGEDPNYYSYFECNMNNTNSEKGREIAAKLDAFIAARTPEEIEELFVPRGIACSPVLTVGEALDHPHFRARGDVITYEDPISGDQVKAWNVFPKLEKNPGKVWRGAPHLGQDTEAVLGTVLGYTEDKIRSLKEKRIVGNPHA